MKKVSKLLALTLTLLMLVLCLAACSNSSSGNSESAGNSDASAQEEEVVADAEQADDGGEDLGFTEVEIFSGVEQEFLNLNAVYFQPVDMTGGYNAEDYDCHLELDVSALQNGLGYGTGDWVPYLTVEYEVTKNDSDYSVSGTFMPMAASDGPHYGANIKMDGDGMYTVTFTVKFPDSSTYLIHTDETGPDDHDFPAAIVYTYDNWQFTDGAWAE
ncbi:MAG: iron transporter [Clostridia bacterium]|nr:iron transporter [Clostridia bacterium]